MTTKRKSQAKMVTPEGSAFWERAKAEAEKMTREEITALWESVSAKRADKDGYHGPHNNAREEAAKEAKKRLDDAFRPEGWLPPLEDKKGIAAEEVERFRREVEFCTDMIARRMRRGILIERSIKHADLLKLEEEVKLPSKGDANGCEAYDADELLTRLVGACVAYGGLVSDSQMRRELEKFHRASVNGLKGVASPKKKPAAPWSKVFLVVKSILDAAHERGEMLTRNTLHERTVDSCREQRIKCPQEGLFKKLTEWKKQGKISWLT